MEETNIISIALKRREPGEIADALYALIDHASCEQHRDLYLAIGERISRQREISSSGLAAILKEEVNNFLEKRPEESRRVIEMLAIPNIVNELVDNDSKAVAQTLEMFQKIGTPPELTPELALA